MTEPIEEQVLREAEAFPCTNMTRLFRSAGRVLPENVGGGCLWIAAKLGERLERRLPGIRIQYFDLGVPGSHTTTVSDDGRDRKVYEPSLFQVCPFSLTQFLHDPRQCLSETFPLEGGYRITLKYSWLSKDEELKMEALSPRGYTLREFRYQLRSPAAISAADPYADLPFIDAQDSVFVHVLNPDYTKTMLTLGTRTRRLNVGRQSDRLFTESEPGFQSRFERVASQLEISDRELRELLFEALEIHNRHYPAA
jgi:hypothetical protein